MGFRVRSECHGTLASSSTGAARGVVAAAAWRASAAAAAASAAASLHAPHGTGNDSTPRGPGPLHSRMQPPFRPQHSPNAAYNNFAGVFVWWRGSHYWFPLPACQAATTSCSPPRRLVPIPRDERVALLPVPDAVPFVWHRGSPAAPAACPLLLLVPCAPALHARVHRAGPVAPESISHVIAKN